MRAIVFTLLLACATACAALEPKVGPLRGEEEDAAPAECTPSPGEDAAEYGGGVPDEDAGGCGDDS